MRRIIICAAATLSFGSATAQDAALEMLDIQASPIANFKIGSDEKQFGRLEFAGGLEMASAGQNFGALSAFRFLDAGSKFIGVADTGFWFSGSVTRDELGRPRGISGFRMKEMTDAASGGHAGKWQSDAEGLLVDGARLTASFERVHRISSGTFDADTLEVDLKNEKLPIAKTELRSNRGFETLALSSAGGALSGARVAVTEKSLNKVGNIFAAVLEGPKKGIFYIARNGEFDITDGDFLPNGDLLLLERRFNMADGIAMRLRQIPGDKIEPGATVDGEVVLEANMSYQIDNMEALDVWQDASGATRITMMSDDNHSILQRNILLEFKLADAPESTN